MNFKDLLNSRNINNILTVLDALEINYIETKFSYHISDGEYNLKEFDRLILEYVDDENIYYCTYLSSAVRKTGIFRINK